MTVWSRIYENIVAYMSTLWDRQRDISGRLFNMEEEMASVKEALAKIREEVAQTRGIIASLRKERESLLQLVGEHKANEEELQKVIDEFTAMNDEFDEAVVENPEEGEVVVDPAEGGGDPAFDPSANRPARARSKKRR